MRDTNFGHFCDAQDFATLDSTGVISDNIIDLEENAATDMMVIGFVNIIITSTTGVTVGAEGMEIAVLTDDAAALTTTRTAAGAGYVTVGAITLLGTIDIVAGREFSIPFMRHVCKKYMGLWIKAGSSSFAGTLYLEAYLSTSPIGAGVLQGYQKKPS